MSRRLAQTPLTTSLRIVLPVVLTVALFVVSILFVFLPSLEYHLMEHKRQTVRELTATVKSLLEGYAENVRVGHLDLAEAQARAGQRLRELRYGPENKDYFWVTDLEPRMLIHPYRPDLEGKDVSEFKDPNGKPLFQEAVRVATTKGHGYIDYLWQWKDEPDRIEPKVSYVVLFEPWNWVVGTGIYINDVQEEVQALTGELTRASGVILAVMVALSSYVAWHGLRVERGRRQAQVGLRERETRLRTIVENAGEIIYTLSPDGRFTFVSPAWTELLGHRTDEVEGNSFEPYVHPDDVAGCRRVLEAAIANEESHQEVEYRVQHKNGEWRWHQSQVTSAFDEETGEIYCVGIAQDTTRRRRAEEAVRESEELLNFAVAQMPVPVIIAVPPDIRIVKINTAAVSIIFRPGLDVDTVIEEKYRQYKPVFHPDGTPWEVRDMPLTRAVLDGETTTDQEVVIQDGSESRWVLANAAPLHDDQGHIVAGIVVFPEITHRKRGEAALRDSEERLRLALEAAALAIWEWKAEPDAVEMTRNGVKMLGFSVIEQREPSRFWLKHVHTQDRRRLLEAVREHLRARTPALQVEVRIQNPLGEWRWLSVRASVTERDDRGRPTRMLGTCHDISERKQAEDQVRHRQEQLVQADKMASLGVLVSGVAHEINNPTFAIMASASSLASFWEALMPRLAELSGEHDQPLAGAITLGEMRDYIPELMASITESAERIRYIVQELRDFARQKPAELERRVQINPVVESAIALVSNMVKKSTGHFKVHYGDDLPGVKGDYRRLEQVFINLLQNACQALPDRNRAVEVSTHYDAPREEVVMAVRDEGTGIDPEALPRILDPFFTTKRESGGTGLGLSISATIVREHGGRLEFDSMPGQGTTARVVLPAAPSVDDKEAGHEQTAAS